MGCFSSDPPAPINYGQQMADTIRAQAEFATGTGRFKDIGSQYDLESKYQPLYAGLDLSNLDRLLYGTPEGGQRTVTDRFTADQTGWYGADGKFISAGDPVSLPTMRGNYGHGAGLGQLAIGNLPPGFESSFGGRYFTPGTAPQEGATWRTKGSTWGVDRTEALPAQRGLIDLLRGATSAQRMGDIADVANYGGAAREAILASDPASAALLAKLNRQANEGLDAGSMLTADEARQMEQASRAAFSARGMAGGNRGIADELFRKFDMGQNLLRQRQQFAQGVLGSNRAVTGDPFMQILNRSSGAQTIGQGQQMLPGRQFNPESPLAASIAAGNQGYSAMFADPSTISKIGAVSNLTGSFIGSVMGGMI